MFRLFASLVLVFASLAAGAEPFQLDAVSVTTNSDGSQTYTLTLQVLILMTVLTVLPAILLAMTSFTRIIIVLAILRQALGTAQTPSSQILIGMALFMTGFIMMPVFDRINAEAVQPYVAEQSTFQEAVAAASVPVREFMLAQTRETDLALFTELGNSTADSLDSVPFTVLLPAFLTSELKTAFQIGFLVFIPFLVIDLVIASVLMSMGMMMLSPMIISLPFKIMLFVLVDGWALIVGTLANSFYV
mgnify:CR=1 FL=1